LARKAINIRRAAKVGGEGAHAYREARTISQPRRNKMATYVNSAEAFWHTFVPGVTPVVLQYVEKPAGCKGRRREGVRHALSKVFYKIRCNLCQAEH